MIFKLFWGSLERKPGRSGPNDQGSQICVGMQLTVLKSKNDLKILLSSWTTFSFALDNMSRLGDISHFIYALADTYYQLLHGKKIGSTYLYHNNIHFI